MTDKEALEICKELILESMNNDKLREEINKWNHNRKVLHGYSRKDDNDIPMPTTDEMENDILDSGFISIRKTRVTEKIWILQVNKPFDPLPFGFNAEHARVALTQMWLFCKFGIDTRKGE